MMSRFTIRSPSFHDNENIPDKYTCQGDNMIPPLEFENVPDNTLSIVLIIDDPDAPGGTFDHWIVWNIPPGLGIEEGKYPPGAVNGKNDFGNNEYGGPCPPSGMHRYIFKAYALDTILSLREGASKHQLELAMESHIIASTHLTGYYSK